MKLPLPSLGHRTESPPVSFDVDLVVRYVGNRTSFTQGPP